MSFRLTVVSLEMATKCELHFTSLSWALYRPERKTRKPIKWSMRQFRPYITVWLWTAVYFDTSPTHHCYFCCGMKTYLTWTCSRSYSMSLTWTEIYFHGCPPHFVELFRGTPQDYDALQRFECDGSWSLREPLRTNMPPGHMIMALPLTVQNEKSRIQYVAKTVSGPDHYLVSSLISLKVSEFPVEKAEAHIRMTGL